MVLGLSIDEVIFDWPRQIKRFDRMGFIVFLIGRVS